jgi:hypothetical protein
MVNGGLRGNLVPALPANDASNAQATGADRPPWREHETIADPPARPTVRASLLACTAISLVALWIAAFEMPVGDLPGLVLFPVLPLTAMAFIACSL